MNLPHHPFKVSEMEWEKRTTNMLRVVEAPSLEGKATVLVAFSLGKKVMKAMV